MGILSFDGKKIKNKIAYMKIIEHNLRHTTKDNIDTTKTIDNIVLSCIDNIEYDTYLQEKKEQIAQHNKTHKTKNRMIKQDSAFSINYTFQATNESLSREQHINFLKEIDTTLRAYFKDQEILQSIIHLDETTPHLHFNLSFFKLKDMRFNQKELSLNGITRYENIEKALEPILKKYGIDKRQTLQEKIQELPQEPRETIKKIQETTTNPFEKISTIKKILARYGKNKGGETYIPPKHITEIQKLEQKTTKAKKIKSIANQLDSIFLSCSTFFGFNQKEAKKQLNQYILKVSNIKTQLLENKELEAKNKQLKEKQEATEKEHLKNIAIAKKYIENEKRENISLKQTTQEQKETIKNLENSLEIAQNRIKNYVNNLNNNDYLKEKIIQNEKEIKTITQGNKNEYRTI